MFQIALDAAGRADLPYGLCSSGRSDEIPHDLRQAETEKRGEREKAELRTAITMALECHESDTGADLEVVMNYRVVVVNRMCVRAKED